MKDETTISFSKNLHRKILKFLTEDNNKIKYRTPKAFIEIAVLEKLEKEDKEKS